MNKVNVHVPGPLSKGNNIVIYAFTVNVRLAHAEHVKRTHTDYSWHSSSSNLPSPHPRELYVDKRLLGDTTNVFTLPHLPSLSTSNRRLCAQRV